MERSKLQTATRVLILVDSINKRFPGFSKIIGGIQSALPDAVMIDSLEGVSNSDIVIAVGIVAAKRLAESGLPKRIAFIIDSSLLGYSSVCRFYLRKRMFLDKELYLNFLRYVKYYPIERKIVKVFQTVIVVSIHDCEYLKKKFGCSNMSVLSNGVDADDHQPGERREFDYTLGVLAYWGAGAYDDFKWFIESYLPELQKTFPQLRMITAGRGASAEMIEEFRRHGIEHVGEIEKLSDFFKNIDIFITTLRKECGILNKVLDAFAHKKIVLGLRHNMLAFKELHDGYFTYDTIGEMISAIQTIRENPILIEAMTQKAFAYVKEYHDWNKNYAALSLMVTALANADTNAGSSSQTIDR